MPICTSCKHNREIERLRSICAACKGPSDNFGGEAHIGAHAPGETIWRHVDQERLYTMRANTSSRIAGADERTVELLMKVIAEFSQLTDQEAPVVARRLRGQENWKIAHEMRLSKAVIWKRWEDLKKKNPIWAAIDNGLIGKRNGGAKKREPRPCEMVQQDLFSFTRLATPPLPGADNAPDSREPKENS